MTTDDKKAEDFELYHFGIKGMKWGVRRKEGPDGTVGSTVRQQKRQEKKAARTAKRQQENREAWKRPVTDDAKSANEGRTRVKKHGTDALSNDDLKKVVNRMNLEQQYSALVENSKASSRRRGASTYISDILKESGQELAKETLKWAATEGVKMAFKSRSGGGQSGPVNTQAYRVPTNLIGPARRAIGR